MSNAEYIKSLYNSLSDLKTDNFLKLNVEKSKYHDKVQEHNHRINLKKLENNFQEKKLELNNKFKENLDLLKLDELNNKIDHEKK